MEYDPSQFTIPDFKTVEIPIAVAPAPGQYSVAEFQADDLEYDYPVLVDRVVVTEDSLITENPDPGAGTSMLPLVEMQWWQKNERSYGDHIPLPALDDRRPRLSVVDAPAAGAGYGQLVWEPRGPVPMRVKNQEALVVDWENPNVAVAPGFAGGILFLSAQGYLEQSKRNYTLLVPVTFAAGAVGAAGLIAGTTNPALAGRNETGEDLIVRRIVITIDSAHYPQLAVDARIWRHLRIMPRFSGRENERLSVYRQRAPLVVFGDQTTVNNHGINLPFEPKLPVDLKGSIHFNFRNFNPANGTQIVLTFCGWRKPTGR